MDYVRKRELPSRRTMSLDVEKREQRGMGIRTRAAVVRYPGGPFSFEEVMIDDPQDHELVVRILACGVCHSDIAVRDGKWFFHFPCVLGHEGAGIVETVGNKVSRVRVGDKVLLSFRSCGKCRSCKRGHPAHCTHFDEVNFRPVRMDGSSTMWDASGAPIGGNFFGQSSFAYRSLTGERNVIRLDCSETDLLLFAPLGCGLQAGAGTVLNELRPSVGDSFLILGAGAVGFGALMAAKIAQTHPIIVVDVVESRLRLARELGADIIINAKSEPIASSVKKHVDCVMHAVDTTGRSSVINEVLGLLHPKGAISLLAISADDNPLQSPTVHQTVIESIAGNSNPQECIPHLIDLYKMGVFPFDRLIKNYRAQDINTAVGDSLQGAVIKPVLCFS